MLTSRLRVASPSCARKTHSGRRLLERRFHYAHTRPVQSIPALTNFWHGTTPTRTLLQYSIHVTQADAALLLIQHYPPLQRASRVPFVILLPMSPDRKGSQLMVEWELTLTMYDKN